MPSWYGRLCEFENRKIRRIHEASLKILEEVGVLLDHDVVLDRVKHFGAAVDFDKKVARFSPDLVEAKLHGFKNACDRGLPGETLRFTGGGGAQRIIDWETDQRRTPTVEDLADAVKIADKLPHIDEVDFFLLLPGIPDQIMDLHIWKTVWTWTAKTGGGGLARNGNAIMNYSDQGLDYLMRLAAIKLGGMDEVRRNPFIGGFVGFASPLRIGHGELRQMLKLIELGQYVGIGSNVVAGVQAPASIAGVVAMENAERLGGLMAALSVDENAHVYFTNHPQYLDMGTGNIANGSTEHALAALLGRAVFNYYGFNRHFVCHPAVLTGSAVCDEQAGLEKMMGMLMAGLAGHRGVCSLGCLSEAYSHVQLVIDNEIAGMVKRLLAGVSVNEEEIALDLMLEAGVGGNYLDHPERIMDQVRRDFHPPGVLGRSQYSMWSRSGSKTVIGRAKEKVRELLAGEHRRYLTDGQIADMDALIEEAEKELVGT